MTHEPLGSLSGTLKGAQKRWAPVEKDDFIYHHILSYLATFRVS